MCLCHLFSAKMARQLVNRKDDFFYKTNRFAQQQIESNRFESRIGTLYCMASNLVLDNVLLLLNQLVQSVWQRQRNTSNVLHLQWQEITAGGKLLGLHFLLISSHTVLSVLWRCWLGGRKGIRPVKNWVVGCWHGYLSGERCRLAYGPADATATHWNSDTSSPG